MKHPSEPRVMGVQRSDCWIERVRVVGGGQWTILTSQGGSVLSTTCCFPGPRTTLFEQNRKQIQPRKAKAGRLMKPAEVLGGILAPVCPRHIWREGGVLLNLRLRTGDPQAQTVRPRGDPRLAQQPPSRVQFRALTKSWSQGEVVRVSNGGGRHAHCHGLTARSGCGMRARWRPSREQMPATPPGDPLGFMGYCSVGCPASSAQCSGARPMASIWAWSSGEENAM